MDQFQVPDNIIRLIHKYCEMPILWNTRDPSYHKKDLRTAALKQIATYMQTWVPDCNYNMVKDKIANLRSTYRRSYKDQQKKIRSSSK